MSDLYFSVCWIAAFLVSDDIGLGNIHPVKGFFVLFALLYNVAYTLYKAERKRCRNDHENR